jgi:GNAT superfamily N-acetyltransferase
MPASSDIFIRPAAPRDRDAILDFVRRMGFNARDAVTWDGLRMTAMTAWRGDQLIGAIPVEPRPLLIGGGRAVTTLHQTVVAVDPQYRGGGIGSMLQVALAANPPVPAELTTVFREEPESPAYRWYRRTGFSPAMHIDSWFVDSPAETEPAPSAPQFGITTVAADEAGPADFAVNDALWSKVLQHSGGGFVNRAGRPLAAWLPVHPYRRQYRFLLLTLPSEARGIQGYALLGVGRMHSKTERVDILDLVGTVPAVYARLAHEVLCWAKRSGCAPVRWPLSTSDADAIEAAERAGFEKRWGFDLLIKPLGATRLDPADLAKWRYAGVDYI